jgi:hypothetical protein
MKSPIVNHLVWNLGISLESRGGGGGW